MFSTIVSCIGWAFISGAIASRLWLYKHQETLDKDLPNYSGVKAWIEAVQKGCEIFTGDYKFFPTFLIFGLLGRTVEKWQNWLGLCLAVQGRLMDVAVSVGGSVKSPDSEETRTILWQLYCYLNTVHALLYEAVNSDLPHTVEEFIPLGLLTDEEAQYLEPMSTNNMHVLNCMLTYVSNSRASAHVEHTRCMHACTHARTHARKRTCRWITGLISDLVDAGTLSAGDVHPALVPKLRGACSELKQMHFRHVPNVWTSVCRVIPTHVTYTHARTHARLHAHMLAHTPARPLACM